MRRVTIVLAVILLVVFAAGAWAATVFVSTDKEAIRTVHDAFKVKAWIVEASIDVPLAKKALPESITKHFQAAALIANAALQLGDNPSSLMRADAVLQVVDPLASCIAKGECIGEGPFHIDPATIPPAVAWTLSTSDNLCSSKSDLDTWADAECLFYGRNIGGTGVNDKGTQGRVVCAGKPPIRIRLYCE